MHIYRHIYYKEFCSSEAEISTSAAPSVARSSEIPDTEDDPEADEALMAELEAQIEREMASMNIASPAQQSQSLEPSTTMGGQPSVATPAVVVSQQPAVATPVVSQQAAVATPVVSQQPAVATPVVSQQAAVAIPEVSQQPAVATPVVPQQAVSLSNTRGFGEAYPYI